MSDALPLPPHPNLEQYQTLARELQGLDPTAPGPSHEIDRERRRIEDRWNRFKASGNLQMACSSGDAQLFVAREHGFTSWETFAAHVESLGRPDSPTSRFEAAAEAIVAGDAETLRTMLRDHPELVHARSDRDHQSTLLHYVAANGVEDFRQRTPPNIVEIVRMLLQAGADVNATSKAYGGGATALGLAATSLHPQRAGVQIALLEVLLESGAKIEQGAQVDDGGAVTGCLANGQPGAASYLASRGAVLNLEGAAGLGRLDVVATFFDDSDALVREATRDQLVSALLYACGYGHPDVVRLLIEKGSDPNVRNGGGETGLHWASFGPYPEVATLLLKAGAAVDVRDNRYKSTPLDWALFAWAKADGESREHGYELVRLLVQAGASVYVPWLESATAEQVRTDVRMREILRDAITAVAPDLS